MIFSPVSSLSLLYGKNLNFYSNYLETKHGNIAQNQSAFLFFLERVSEHMSNGWGEEIEGQRERKAQAGPTLSTKPHVGLNLTTLRS